MQQDYISAAQAAEKWGVSLRQVQRLIAAGRVEGAKKLGHNWIIPADSEKPQDFRIEKKTAGKAPACPLPYGIPNFLLSPFYSAPGTLDALEGQLKNDEAKALCAGLTAYYRGRDGDARQVAETLLAGKCCFETQVGCSMLLATCAMYSGSLQGWNRARARLLSLSRKRPDSAALVITETALSGVLYVKEAPEWLQAGRFTDFSPNSYPALFYIYAKWLLMQKRFDGLLAAIEPMIAVVHTAGALLSELYLHLIAGAAYRTAGDEKSAAGHIEAALDLSLPDGLYGALAEYRRQLGTPLDDALRRRDPDAFIQVRDAYDRLAAGFTVLHNAVTGNNLTNELTLREYETAALALAGETNADIAARMGVAVSSVKSYFNTIYQKLGVSSRSDLSQYIL